MRAHPAADLFPLLDGDEFAALKEDIRKHGQVEPCITWVGEDGTEWLLDGRNRARACEELGIEPLTKPIGGPELEALSLVVSLNIRRRHLTPSQLGTIAAELEPLFAAAAKERMAEAGRGGKVATPSKAREQAARAVGASPRYVQTAKKLKAEAPEKFEAVKRGELTLSKAAKQLGPPRASPEPKVRRGRGVFSDEYRPDLPENRDPRALWAQVVEMAGVLPVDLLVELQEVVAYWIANRGGATRSTPPPRRIDVMDAAVASDLDPIDRAAEYVYSLPVSEQYGALRGFLLACGWSPEGSLEHCAPWEEGCTSYEDNPYLGTSPEWQQEQREWKEKERERAARRAAKKTAAPADATDAAPASSSVH